MCLQEGQKVEATVELVRDEYLALSLPDRGAAIGYAATQGYNLRSLDPHARFRHGQRLAATVAALPTPETGESSLNDRMRHLCLSSSCVHCYVYAKPCHEFTLQLMQAGLFYSG